MESEELSIDSFFSSISLAIGRTLKRLRQNQGLTGADFGRLVNLSQQQISRYECGINHINVSMLLLLLEKLDITVGEFNTLLIEEINLTPIKNHVDLDRILNVCKNNGDKTDHYVTSKSSLLFG